MNSTLDALQISKDLQAAEALARLLRERQQADLALLATQTDLVEVEAEVLKWLIALLAAQTATMVALAKPLP